MTMRRGCGAFVGALIVALAGVPAAGSTAMVGDAGADRTTMVGDTGADRTTSCFLGRSDAEQALLRVLDCPEHDAAGTESVIADRYIVVLKPRTGDPTAVAKEHTSRFGAAVKLVYRSALKGYSARIPEARLAALRADPRVAYVEPDQLVRAHGQETPTGVRRIFADENPNLAIDGRDGVRVDADVAILDTGVDATHPDLRVVGRADCTFGDLLATIESDNAGSCLDHAGYDDVGHGTHVAGTVAALDNGIGVVGVAPGARIWSVKVLSGGSGLMSWIVAGVDWVTAEASTIEVANMSLGCRCSSAALDKAIAASVSAGVVYTVSAGNSGADASDFSPADHPDVITVSAMADFDGAPGGSGAATCLPPSISQKDDALAFFSNFGRDVEVTAPGVCIRSTWPNGEYADLSGTSMSSPHVAGAAAVLASASKPTDKAGVEAIRKTIIDAGNYDWSDVILVCSLEGCSEQPPDGVQEPLLDVKSQTAFSPLVVRGRFVDNHLPLAQFTRRCDAQLRCEFDGTGSRDSDGSIASYRWDFGDPGRSGSTPAGGASGPLVSHTFTRAGTYLVVLTVTDDDGARGKEWAAVTVSDGTRLAKPRCGQPGDTKCEAWIRTYDNPNGYNVDGFTGFGVDFTTDLAASPSGDRVYVTGFSWDNTTQSLDAATVAYDEDGRQLWVARYDGPAGLDEIAYSITVSPDGRRVYTTGTQDVCYVFGGCSGDDFLRERFDAVTVAYDAATGNRLWASSFGAADAFDGASDVAMSEDGAHVVVTGGSGADDSYVTISYDAATGAEEWASRYAGSDFGSFASSVASRGNRAYVTGFSDGDYATVAYDIKSGERLWAARYDSGGFDLARHVGVSPDGSKVYAFGATESFPDSFLSTVAYDATTGKEIWAQELRRPGFIVAGNLAVGHDRVYVGGVAQPSFAEAGSMRVAAYDAGTGEQAWVVESPSGFSMGSSLSLSPNGSQLYTVDNVPSGAQPAEYNGSDFLVRALRTSDGNQEWVARYNSSPRGIQQNYPTDVAAAGGRVYVAGDFFTDRIGFTFENPRNISRYGVVAYNSRATPKCPAPRPPVDRC